MMITASASIRGIWTEAEASHEVDEVGSYTFIELIHATDDGSPLGEITVDGHITQGELHSLLTDLAQGITPAGVQVDWANSMGAVA